MKKSPQYLAFVKMGRVFTYLWREEDKVAADVVYDLRGVILEQIVREDKP